MERERRSIATLKWYLAFLSDKEWERKISPSLAFTIDKMVVLVLSFSSPPSPSIPFVMKGNWSLKEEEEDFGGEKWWRIATKQITAFEMDSFAVSFCFEFPLFFKYHSPKLHNTPTILGGGEGRGGRGGE